MFANWRVILALLIVLALAALLPQLADQYYDHLLVLTLIYIVVAISFNLYLGFVGELTLAHSAFFGLGGYTTGLITVEDKAGWPTGVGLLVAVAICAAGAVVLGVAALRLRGAYFILITVAFLGILAGLSTTLYNLTGSTSGLRNIPSPSFGFVSFDTTQSFYYLTLGFLIAIIVVVYRLVNSRVGRGFLAIRDNQDLANSLGINPSKYKMIAFIFSAVIAGVGGWLYAHYVHIMDPAVFGFGLMFDTAFMVILGGTGTLVGPILGGFIVIFVPELFVEHVWEVDEAWRTAALAVFMLVVIIGFPSGVWGFLKTRWMQYQAMRAMPATTMEQVSPLRKLTDPLKALLNVRGSTRKG